MFNTLLDLALRTLKTPRDVAAELIALKLPRETLWMLLALAVVLNTIVYQLTVVAVPQDAALPAFFASPLLFAALIAGGLIISVYALTFVGRMLGGKGTLDVVLVLLVWLQYLRFAVQIAALLLSPIIPGLAALGLFAASIYGIWLLLNFVDVGHGLNSLLTSFGVLFMAMIAISFALVIVLSLFGIQNLGLDPYA